MNKFTNTVNYILLIIFIGTTNTIQAYNLKQITKRENLSNSSITSFCQDNTGLMWIGTCDGLNTYNGLAVSTFQSQQENQYILGNLIDNIIETENGVLWVQTYYGLNKIDKNKNTLEHFEQFNKRLHLGEDSNNNLFVIQNNNAIYYFSRLANKFEKIAVPGLVFNDILNMLIDENNIMWIVSQKGDILSYKINVSKEGKISLSQIKKLKHPSKIIYSFNDEDRINFVDSKGELYDFDTKKQTGIFVANIQERIDKDGEIADIIKYKNDYFIGFKTSGLYILRHSSNSYYYEKVPINSGIFCLSRDRYQDMIWIGSDGQGVYMYVEEPYSFRSVLLDDLPINMGKPIRAIFVDSDNTLWIGSKGDGILRIHNYDMDKNNLGSDLTNLNIKNSNLWDNSVYSFSKSKKDILWIGTENGLNYYSYQDHSIKKIDLIANGKRIKYVHDVYEQDSVLWIATVGMGFLKAEISWNRDIPSLHNTKEFTINNGDISSNYFFSIFPENDSTLWFANRGQGAFRINTKTYAITPYSFDSKDLNKTLNEVSTIIKDNNNNYLFGTNYGLIKWNLIDKYNVFNKTSGFPNNAIHNILKESDNIFWFSTNQGIVCYNPDNETFRTYDYRAGLNVVEFSDGAAFKDEVNNRIFFGGINGFISIQKENYNPKIYMPRIYFEDLSILGKDHNIKDFLSVEKDKEVLTLNYSQNFFTLSFIAMDYINGNNYNYFYKLEGLNDEWVDNGNSNFLSFTNFRYGEYTLLVKYYDKTNNLESDVYSIKIKITPPWYLSPIAYIFYFLLVVACIMLLIYYSMARIAKKRRREMRILEQQHKEDVYESKLRFFTNIAHEFCTPLTLIYGPCTRILEHKNTDKFITKYTKIIQQNAERLNSLIQDLIKFRGIESGYKKPLVQQVDISDVTNKIIYSFYDIVDSRGINYQKNIPANIIWNSDKDFIITIISNFISNAFNNAPDKGEVDVTLEADIENLFITISNTGKGIKEEDMTKIFDRYNILENFEKKERTDTTSRSGFGLAISYNMVNLLHGSIDIESTPNEWTHFRIRLPYLEPETESKALIDEDFNEIVKSLQPDNLVKFDASEYIIDENKPTILVIDGETDVLWLICDIFADKFNMIPVSSATKGLEVLDEMYPDIILCDVVMSEIDGIEFTKRLKENTETAHIPIILLSSKHEIEEQIEGINAGAELYITKPFNISYLTSAILQLISRKETLKDYYSSPASAFEFTDGKLTHKEHKKLVKAILNIINKNITNKDLSVNFIAEKMNMSSRNLYRKVDEIENLSISDMIRDCRIKVAEDLLIKSRLTIEEIAFKSGFSNRVSFFKAFSKKNGCTPKEFRSRNSIT